MKNKLFYSIPIILLFLTGCTNNNRVSENEYFQIEIKEAVKDQLFVDIVDNLKVVQLQQDPLFHISQIDKVIYENSEFYVLDTELDNLFVFDDTGKFKRKISQYGIGPGEYIDINDFTIINSKLYLLSREGMTILKFDLNGSFIKSLKLDYNPLLIENLDQNLALYLTYFNEFNENLRVINEIGETIFVGFPFPEDIFPMSLRYVTGGFSSNYQGVLYSDPTSSYIHQVDKQGNIYKKYLLNFQNDFFPEDERYDFRKFFAEIQRGNLNFLTNYFAETENVLSFRFNKKKPPHSLIPIHQQNGYFFKSKNIVYIFESDEFENLLSGPVGTIENKNKFISYVKPSVDNLQIINTTLSELGLNLISVENLEMNPVLVVFNFFNY
jgi:hypothetical protein